MPRSRDVTSYPTFFTNIATLMRVKKDFHTDYMEVKRAKALQQMWYAFVRAHYATIERIRNETNRLRLQSNNPLTSEQVGPARNKLMQMRAYDSQLDTIKKFEAQVDIDLMHTPARARIHFISKDLKYADPVVDALFAALPAAQRVSAEDEQFFLESPAPKREVVAQQDNKLRDDPMLAHLFTMPDEERLRHGSMRYDEIRAFHATHTPESWTAYLQTITDPLVLEQINAALNDPSAGQLDTGGA